jgi:hypothetical protein
VLLEKKEVELEVSFYLNVTLYHGVESRSDVAEIDTSVLMAIQSP